MTSGPEFPQQDFGAPPRLSGKDPRRLLHPPAIALIVISSLSILSTSASIVFQIVMASFMEQMVKMQEEMAKSNPVMKAWLQFASPAVQMVVESVGLVLSVFVLIGAIKMLRVRSYGLAMAAAIVEIVNISLGCCCIPFSVGIGIWALVILMRPDVKAAFTESR